MKDTNNWTDCQSANADWLETKTEKIPWLGQPIPTVKLGNNCESDDDHNDDCAHVNDDCVIWICESDDDDCDDDKNWPVFDHRLLDSTN